MKPILLILLAGLGVLSGCMRVEDSSQWTSSHGDLKAVTNLNQRGEIAAEISALQVSNQFGLVRVTGSDAGPGDWSWHLTVRARSEELAAQAAAKAGCRSKREGGRFRLIVSLPTQEATSYQSDLEIRVPRSVMVETENRFGRTALSDLGGEVQIGSQNGEVDIRRVAGSVRAHTSFAALSVVDSGPVSLHNQNGRIEVQQVRGPVNAETSFAMLAAINIDGPAKLRNQNGSIELSKAVGDADLKTSFASLSAEGIRGDVTLVNQNGSIKGGDISGSVAAKTSFGPLEVDAGGANLDCRNQNGPIHVRAPSLGLTNLQASTSFSDLTVRLPNKLPAPAVVAQTSFGTVESDFPVLLKPAGTDPFADVSAGVPRLRLHNQNGSIKVIRE